jgi:hypothetical protein|nr:MAG TPA: hypothetical protein [Caudoviricetes sp.]
MNQNVKKKIMKSKLKYYAQVIGVNLLAALIPILAVVLIYVIGKLKVIYTHPSFISQVIYDCCLWAITISLVGFFIGFLLLVWADNWRKTKLMVLKVKKKRKEEEEVIRAFITGGNAPNSHFDKISDKGIEFENTSGLTAKEIYNLYVNRKVLVKDPSNDSRNYRGSIAGYDGPLLIVGFSIGVGVDPFTFKIKMQHSGSQDQRYAAGCSSYLKYDPDDVHILKNF